MQSWVPNRKLHHRHVEFGVRAKGGLCGEDTVCMFMAHVRKTLLLSSPYNHVFILLPAEASWDSFEEPQFIIS